jgi:hypothetical protein
MPVNAPVPATVRIVQHKTTIAAYVTFPKGMNSHYIQDVKADSIKCNGKPATNTQVSRDAVIAQCSNQGGKQGATVAVEGEFGDKYYYGDRLTFTGIGVIPRR